MLFKLVYLENTEHNPTSALTIDKKSIECLFYIAQGLKGTYSLIE